MDWVAAIQELVRNMVTFSVLAAFCTHLLPEKKYRNYARFTIGLIYICMIMDAVGSLLGKTVPVFAF